VRRREFIALIGGAAAGWPLTARSQPAAMPLVGFLGPTSAKEWARFVAAFQGGRREAGFVDGRNVKVEYHWAEGRYDQLPAMAADLVARHVDVIVTIATPAAAAAKAATANIPIVFFLGSDPVKLGYVASLSRPGGNMTGVTMLADSLGAKRLQLMREVVRQPVTFGMLVNPTNETAVPDSRDVRGAAAEVQQ
jgi:putative tryptophan/tyrosine transport system substrate-binding protein